MKRIVVCCDGKRCVDFWSRSRKSSSCALSICADACRLGTWLDASMGLSHGKLPIPSNITRISEAIKPVSSRGIQQVVLYQAGIGSTGNILNRVVGG